MFDLRIEGKQPIYEQICAGVSRLISEGVLAPGEKLPAVREVAKSLGVNPNTVQKAYMQLERSGLIYSVPAKGSYVSQDGRAARAIKEEALKKLDEAVGEAVNAGFDAEEIKELAYEAALKKGRK